MMTCVKQVMQSQPENRGETPYAATNKKLK